MIVLKEFETPAKVVIGHRTISITLDEFPDLKFTVKVTPDIPEPKAVSQIKKALQPTIRIR